MIVVEPRKTADRPVICPVNVVPTPQVEVHKSRCAGTCSGELFPEEPKVVPAEMAKEASTDIKSDGVMIDGIMLASEMSPVGSVRDAAEPVSLAAKSEKCLPLLFLPGGSLLRQPPWPL